MSVMTHSKELTSDAGSLTPRYLLRTYSLPAKVFHWATVILVAFMVCSGVLAKQFNEGPVSNTLFTMHKVTGILTLMFVMLRLCYRIMQWWKEPRPRSEGHRRPILHWMLYATIILVPVLGWSGVSAFGSREILPGFVLPEIWPKNVAHSDVLLLMHAYAAFGLLALVALHIGVAMQDYMMRADDPDRKDH
jgi:cytochrome b561